MEDLDKDIQKAKDIQCYLERKLSLLKISFKIESLKVLQEDKKLELKRVINKID